MAYANPYFYNRDNSVSDAYNYVYDLSRFKPTYGSSVAFNSRVNYVQTVDNSLKILPASENNLSIRYNLKFILSDQDAGDLLKTIEIGGGYRNLRFLDPSNMYQDLVGLAEDYSVGKNSQNMTELDITVSSYFKSPTFNWKTSSMISGVTSSAITFDQTKAYSKFDFVYYEGVGAGSNKMDNFWFAKNDIAANTAFNTSNWTKNFFFDARLPFSIRNQFDVYQSEHKNSFIQNVKHKDNSNTLKSFNLKFEAISDKQCRAMLFFLEKKCGYKRFIYDFPIFLKQKKVFVCTQWNHVFRYKDSHDLDVTFIEEPNPNILIDGSGDYYLVN